MTRLSLALKRTALRAITRYHEGRVVRTVDGINIRIGKDWIMGRVALRKGYETRWTHHVSRLLQPGDCAVDVGANFGYFSLVMQKAVGPTGTVHAFEPNPRILASFRENMRLNEELGHVELLEMGLGAAAARAEMVNDTQSSGLGYTQASSTGRIRIVRLDDVLGEKAGAIALIKMDIEGNEVDALRGAGRILGHQDAPLMVIEFNRAALNRGGPDRATTFWTLLTEDHGYTVHGLNGDDRPLRIETADADLPDGNYFFVPPGGAFRARAVLA